MKLFVPVTGQRADHQRAALDHPRGDCINLPAIQCHSMGQQCYLVSGIRAQQAGWQLILVEVHRTQGGTTIPRNPNPGFHPWLATPEQGLIVIEQSCDLHHGLGSGDPFRMRRERGDQFAGFVVGLPGCSPGWQHASPDHFTSDGACPPVEPQHGIRAGRDTLQGEQGRFAGRAERAAMKDRAGLRGLLLDDPDFLSQGTRFPGVEARDFLAGVRRSEARILIQAEDIHFGKKLGTILRSLGTVMKDERLRVHAPDEGCLFVNEPDSQIGNEPEIVRFLMGIGS